MALAAPRSTTSGRYVVEVGRGVCRCDGGGAEVEDLVGRGTAAPGDASATQTRTDGGEDGRGAAGPDGGQQDCLARDAADDVRERLRTLVGMGDGGDERAARGTPTTSTTSMQVALRGRQTTLDPFLGNKVQNDLDRLLALAMYRGGVPFNWLWLKETQNYWDYIVTLLRPSIVPAPRLLSYEGVRTRMMYIIYHEVAALIVRKKAKWKDTGCTLMTDGATDQRNKPIMNFIAASQSGPILIRIINMSARDKTGVSLAEIWEGVIRDDIGVENVNAICTDNAEVMKAAASILQDHPDPAIARIPWIPCAAHCLSLLLRDIAARPWATEVMKRAHKIIKFMRNKQKALHIHRTAKGALDLTRPTDIRFGTAYMMLERLYEQRIVLDGVVSFDQWRDARWAGDACLDEPEVRRLCRSDWWWQQFKKVMDVMEPYYTFLRAMDFDGSSPPGLWDLESILRRRIDVLGLREDERKVVFDIVGDRCAMMRQPAHAAAYLLDPRRRDISLLSDRSSPVALGDLWEDLWTFHCDDPRYWPVDGPHWWDEVAVRDAASKTMHPALWWQLHGGGHPRLQAIAKKVLGMWSTTSPCERNWATHDFIHTKRRNNLSATSVEKLVFIHWNMQLLSASRRPESRYIDVWADMVEDPPEEMDDGDVLPVDADEDEWEAAARANRHKDGRDRITSASRYVGDHYEPGPWADAVWMHREMAQHMQQERDKGKTLAEDQHDVLDDWAGLDPHEDVDAYMGGSFRTMRTLRERVGGQTDVEGLLAREDAERDKNRSYDDARGGCTVYVGAVFSRRSGTVHITERVGVWSRGSGMPTVEQRAQKRLGDRVEALVEQRTEQRAHMSRDCRVEQRAEQRLDVRVDVCVDQRLGHERVVERVGENVLHDVGGVMVERTKERGRVNPQESVTPVTTLSRGSFYGIPLLPPRGAQSSIRVDVGAHVEEPPQRQREGEIASSGGRGALDTVSSHEREGGIHSSILTSHVNTEIPDVSERLPAGRGIVSGVCTRSQAGDGERRKVSSRVLDDDPDHNDDGNTSAEMSGSDYAEEARLRGGDFGGNGDGSPDTEDDAE
ncbi:hypothetical protein CBR_g12292 [Chara braunii]|uniref:DUF659 domain-containing protein n=1 Tax=Chara braunii TaxID=69332 RepID=A0A388KS10_CHABU|nr:hypothetical protein CBR_g12292 [Chara braunii]|eukprot:GBG72723.1 hypothetical protein CBR_g12292 [Chara braunii]